MSHINESCHILTSRRASCDSFICDILSHVTYQRHTATRCNTLQHTATHGNTLQHRHGGNVSLENSLTKHYIYRDATHCNTLQHTATHCNTGTEAMSLLKILPQNTTLTELDLSSNACVRFTAAPVAHIMEVVHSTERVIHWFFFPIHPLCVYLFIELDLSSNTCVDFTATPVAHVMERTLSTPSV